MIKLKDILVEDRGEIPKGKWTELSGKALDKFKEQFQDLMTIANKNSNVTSADINDKDGKKWQAIDNDNDSQPDAVRFYKNNDSGKVVLGIGHDGSPEAKQQFHTMKGIHKGLQSGDEGIASLVKGLRAIYNKIF